MPLIAISFEFLFGGGRLYDNFYVSGFDSLLLVGGVVKGFELQNFV